MANIISFDEAIKALKAGAVGVIPTDTLYGIVACADNEEAVRKLYAAKNRDHKPGTVIAASVEQLIGLGIPARYLRPIEQFWPNPVSVVLPHSLKYLHSGLGAQPFRVPLDAELYNVLLEIGPLLTSSANQPGKEPAVNVTEAINNFGNTIDFYVDGGDLSGREASTIIRVVDDAIEIVRQGAFKISEQGELLK